MRRLQWAVRRSSSGRWFAFEVRADGLYVHRFPTWREAYDYADERARAA